MYEKFEGEDVFTLFQQNGQSLGRWWRRKQQRILIYVAVKDRKCFIQVGRGLEHRMTDAYAGRVVDYILKPNFRNVGFYEGVDKPLTTYLFAAGNIKEGTDPTMVSNVADHRISHHLSHHFSSFGSNNGRTYRNRSGGWIIGPGAGGYIGGGGGGFTGGGGGFGGFGGGSFGGGGAGGSW